MTISSIRDRLVKLESRRRFLDWFVLDRFYATLTADECGTFARAGQLPHPIPNRPSSLDGLDRRSLVKLWEESKRIFGGRTQEELESYVKNGSWPEQRGRLHYSMRRGELFVEWRSGPEEKIAVPGTTAREQGT